MKRGAIWLTAPRIVKGENNRNGNYKRNYSMTNQPDLFTPQAHARKSDGPESHAAAKSVRNITTLQNHILALLKSCGPMTDEGILREHRKLAQVQATDSGLRSRRAELVAMGKIRKSSKPGITKAGRSCAVWEIAE